MILLATTISCIFDPCSEAFNRYFTPEEADWVRSVFRRIANIPLDTVIRGPDSVEPLFKLRETTGFHPTMSALIISLGNHITSPQPICDNIMSATGYYVLSTRDTPLICTCLSAFCSYPDRAEIENPPAWASDKFGIPLPGYTCIGLTDHDSDLMLFPGALLLHEMMHYTNLLEDLPGWDKYIGIGPNGRQIVDWNGKNPSNGYGPWAARVLNLLSIGKKDDYPPYVTLNNADSYIQYALSAYWGWKCQTVFKEAASAGDNSLRSIPPRPAAGGGPEKRTVKAASMSES